LRLPNKRQERRRRRQQEKRAQFSDETKRLASEKRGHAIQAKRRLGDITYDEEFATSELPSGTVFSGGSRLAPSLIKALSSKNVEVLDAGPE
jgi:hypothetical protein